MPDLVHSVTDGQVVTVTLDSPANRNALSAALLTQLHAALSAALADDGARLIVLTGAGPAFCSGADLKEARDAPAAAPSLYPQILRLIWESGKPVICRVNGSARAGGIGLIAACDIAIAPRPATFAFTEVRIGAAPAIIAVTCLRRMTSRAAAEYFLTGESFDADRAVSLGLLTRAVDEDGLNGQTQRYADLLLRGAPGAMAVTKELLREVPAMSLADGLDRMAEVSASRFGSAEAREGMAAFADRREPSWAARP
ncbi:MAG TPA: enoyl-CoA hydratase-related protein [Streptosporangiaceae bacterium]|jgi:methylglutaconyl-CoA hydratase